MTEQDPRYAEDDLLVRHEQGLATMGAIAANQVVAQQQLETVKMEIRAMSAEQGVMQEVGPLHGNKNTELWTGSISYDARVGEGKEIDPAVAEAQIARLNEFFVPVTKGAAKRCVDGRTVEGYNDADPDLYGAPLGPQVQGGSVDEAVAYRAVKGYEKGATLTSDVETYVEDHESVFVPGDHDSDTAAPDCTGCGAVDGQPRKVARYDDPAVAEVIASTAETILSLDGKQVPEKAFDKLQHNMHVMAEHKEAYYDNLPGTLAIIREKFGTKTIERLPSKHGEITFVLNYVRGTTFHRDHYNAETNGQIQSFSLDVWNIIDEHGPEEAHAIIADAAATVMDLTDGSVRLYARLATTA